MNLPNKLTILRFCMVPFCIAAILLPEDLLPWHLTTVIAALLFAGASLTDMLDGQIARKYGLVTDFGKFADPLADKFMVMGAMLAILYRADEIRVWYFWIVLIVIFREFAVTSLRLVLSTTGGVVVAANMLGKIKTCTQIAAVLALIFETALYPAGSTLAAFPPISLVCCVLTAVMTLWSGTEYIVKGLKLMSF